MTGNAFPMAGPQPLKDRMHVMNVRPFKKKASLGEICEYYPLDRLVRVG